MTFRSEPMTVAARLTNLGPNDNIRADWANEEVARLTLADRLAAQELRNRFRRVQFVPRFGRWFSPA